METRYFKVEVSKASSNGQIRIVMRATEHLEPRTIASAHIFERCYDESILRGDLKWDSGRTGEYLPKAVRFFETGAEAARWIEEVRQRLHQLDQRVEFLKAEIEALPV